MSTTAAQPHNEDHNLTFFPPLNTQRRAFISKVLNNYNIDFILDAGCGEGNLVRYLINSGFHHIVGIDNDKSLLLEASSKSKPLIVHHIEPPEPPLKISFIQGNLLKTPPDELTTSFKNQAIVCSEVIEHIPQDQVPELTHTLFGCFQCSVIIITTPNFDFNVWFNQQSENPDRSRNPINSRFRHWDHKFEWTQEEFKQWVENVKQQYPDFESKIHGIGAGKEGSLKFGYCTQAAVFYRKDILLKDAGEINSNDLDRILYQISGEYQHVNTITYPFDARPRWQQITDEVFCILNKHYKSYNDNDVHFEDDNDEFNITEDEDAESTGEDDEDNDSTDDQFYLSLNQLIEEYNNVNGRCDNLEELKESIEHPDSDLKLNVTKTKVCIKTNVCRNINQNDIKDNDNNNNNNSGWFSDDNNDGW